MQQWREVKAGHPDSLVFFRVGDFYEMFNEDAEEGARLLDLTLTSRNNGSSRAPLAGIPFHAAPTYLQRLVRMGRRVAICEQVEEPGESKGIVRREVVEVITPGTVFSDALLEARRNNFLVALTGSPENGHPLGLARTDLSTGELVLQRVERTELAAVLGRIEPAEILLPRSWEGERIPVAPETARTFRSDGFFDAPQGEEEIRRRFGVLNLLGFGLGPDDGLLVSACGALISYLAEVQPSGFGTLRTPTVERSGEVMQLDEMTRRNLELVEPLRSGGPDATLLGILDQALTPMGGRMLRRWIVSPLLGSGAIVARQEGVAELANDPAMRAEARASLRGIRDLERLAAKASAGRISPREMVALSSSLEQVGRLRLALEGAVRAGLTEHRAGLDPMHDVVSAIARALDAESSANAGDGALIRAGYDAELDELRTSRDTAVDWIARLQLRERERTGIQSLKVGFNRVFGYYLEVSRANFARVPADYHRKQTLANAERFFTTELKEWEEKVLGAEERIAALEERLFAELRSRVAAEVPRIQRVAEHVASVDTLAALAEVAMRRGYTRPEVSDDFALEIRSGRHPVVEAMLPSEAFIPNDVVLDREARIIILTGPNMAGKSTLLRQVGLIVLLAQIGSFVPAEHARVGVVDRIFTRVGASDNLSGGQSTFMLEMNETAAILHGATERSLVLLDEIGRGTSTWDGLSVATATAEHLHDHIGAKTIFATHYHELTRLADARDGVINFSVAVRETESEILFLRRLVEGGADRSYGVEVARLAGLPEAVVRRARELLSHLEGADRRDPVPRSAPAARGPDPQLTLPLPHPALERLRGVDVNQLTPLQALNLLAELSAAVRA